MSDNLLAKKHGRPSLRDEEMLLGKQVYVGIELVGMKYVFAERVDAVKWKGEKDNRHIIGLPFVMLYHGEEPS